MSLTPTAAQMEAIVDIATTDRPITRLHGYAGTGKTSVCATEAIRALERQEQSVQVLAPTGKAAKVLRSKGLHGASTIHSYLYAPSKRERLAWRERWDEFTARLGQAPPSIASLIYEIDTAMSETNLDEAWSALHKAVGKKHRSTVERLRDEKRHELAFTAAGAIAHYEDYGFPASSVLLIDEASMVSARVAYDLTRTGSRLVFVGDPAQLPPVKAERSDDAMGKPHHLLTKVHRQQSGSDVLTLATEIRKSTSPVTERTKPKRLHSIDEYDQVLCWRNATREHVNVEVRRRLGRRNIAQPEPGDRLVCLKNTKARDDRTRQWMNGEQATVLEATGDRDGEVYMTVRDDEGAEHEVVSPLEPFGGHRAETRYLDRHGWGTVNPAFTFGYALTVHKSQGSEWPRVLLIDESPDMIRMTERREGRAAAVDQARQWLYTAVTRARDEVHVVRELREVL